MPYIRSLTRLLAIIAMISGLSTIADGQELGVIGLYPPAAAPGESIVVTCRGKSAAWPVKVWSDRTGITGTAEEEEGKLKLVLAEDASPGIYWLRLYDKQHASKLIPFYVERLPTNLEEEPNDRVTEAALIPVPCGVTGRLEKTGDVDAYRITMSAGDQITATVLAHRPFGSPMDAVMQICDSAGNVIDQNDDARGLDPQLTFRAEQGGEYIVRLFAFPETPNSSVRFAGAETFVYRLEISPGSRFEYPLSEFANGVSEGGDSVGLAGEGGESEDGEPRTLAARSIAEAVPARNSTIYYSPDRIGTLESSVALASHGGSVDDSAVVEPVPLELPAEVWGVVRRDGEEDEYSVQLVKDQRIRVTVESRPFLLAMDPYIQVYGPDDDGVGANDDFDKQRRARVDVKAPADGLYRIVVRDATGNGGKRFGYRCRVEPISPSFELSFKPDVLQVAAEETVSLEVDVIRKDGYDKPIRIQAIDLPPGVTCESVVSEMGGDLEKKVTVILAADATFADSPFEGKAIRVCGQVEDESPVDATYLVGSGGGRHRDLWLIRKLD